MGNGRKRFLKQLGSALAITAVPGLAQSNPFNMHIDPTDFAGQCEATDEKYWNRIAKKYYDVADDYINLENGYYGLQSKPVLSSFLQNVNKANREAARFARKEYPGVFNSIKKELAAFLGVSEEEIIITRNATESLNIAIQGYPFLQDDEVLLNQLDYFSMIETFRMLEKRGRIKVNAFMLPPVPANDDEIVEYYRKQLTPKTKVILLTHVSNINGLIIPVAKIAAMAREKGIDTITDSAHALGHFPFSLPALGSDFVGMNLHKWIGNPLGAGVLYVKKERIASMQALFGDVNTAQNNISRLAHIGTTPFAVIMTIPDSLAFHKQMDVVKVAARLHYLKTTWIEGLKDDPKIDILTPAGQALSCAIASFAVKGQPASALTDYLFKQHAILTVARSLGNGDCIRVTPSIYNSADDMKKLVRAVKAFTATI